MTFKQADSQALLHLTEWDKAARAAHERALNQIQKKFQDDISESQNIRNVAKSDNKLDTIKALIQATGTAVQLGQAFKQRAQKNEDAKNGKIYQEAYKAGVSNEYLRTYNAIVEEHKNKKLEVKELIALSEAKGNKIPEDTAQYLIDMSPDTAIVVANRATAQEAATIGTTYLQSELYKNAQATEEIEDDSSLRMRYIAKRFAELGPHPAIAAKYTKSLDDWVATGHFSAQKKIKAKNLRAEDIEIGQHYKSNIEAGSPQLNADLYSRNVEEKLASLGNVPGAAQTAKNYEYNRLRDLVTGTNPILSTNQLHSILKSKVKHEGGEVEIGSKFYMSDEKRNELIRLSEEATAESLETSRENRITVLEQQAITLATNPAKLTELGEKGVKNELLKLKAQIFNADPSHDTSGLDKLLQGNQSLAAYTRLNHDVEGALASGNLTNAIKVVNDSGNIQLQSRLEDLKTLQTRRKDVGFGNADQAQEGLAVRIKNRMGLSLEKGLPLHGQSSLILGELEAEFNRVVNPLLLKGDPTAVQQGLIAVDKLWFDNGGGEDTKTSNGKYAYTQPSTDNPPGFKKGGFLNHRNFGETKVKVYKAVKGTVDLNPTQEIVNSWNKETNDGLNAGGGLGELNVLGRSLAIPENYISANDMVGMIQAKQYSPELIYKASQLGIAPGTLFESQLNALLKSAKTNPNHQALVEEFRLDQVTVPNAEVKFFETFVNNKSIIAHTRQYGLAKLARDYPAYLKRAALIASKNDLKTREELYPNGIPMRMQVSDPLYTEEKQRKAKISSGLADIEAGKDNNEQDDEAIQRAIDDPNSNLYR